MDLEKLLTPGAISAILDQQQPSNPVLQVIGYKPLTADQMAFGNTNTDELRYRLMVGDGFKTHQYCIITNQDLVDDIKNGRLEKWSIVRVTSYQTMECDVGATDSKRTIVFLLNLDLIKRGSEVGQKLSCPEPAALDVKVTMPSITSAHTPTITPNTAPTQPQFYPMDSSDPMAQRGLIKSPRVMRTNHEYQTIGIAELTPYIGKWVVKGRVTSKSGIREYNNAKGGGKLFSFTMADKTGEIKITAFNADCERVYAYVEPNKVYLLGRASVKAADKRYSQADFEITLNSDSLLEEVVDSREVSDVPLAKFNFVSIGALANVQPNQPVDLIGAITEISDVTTVLSKTKNKELKKRNLTIVDMSRHSISVTLWGEQSELFNGTLGDIFVTKAARVGTYGGRSASAGDCIFINPEIPDVRKIKNWHTNLLDSNFTALTQSSDGAPGGGDQWKNLMQMLDMEQTRTITNSGQQSALYAKCKATLMSVGKNPVYKCCPTPGCGKKLVETQSGELKCDKCQQTYSSYKYRYKTDIEISDNSGSCWVTLWDEKAEVVLRMKPDELEKFMKMDNKDAYEKIITRPNFNQYIFTMKSRLDNYNQEERVKLQVINMTPLDPTIYSKQLIAEIRKFAAKANGA